MAQQQLIYCICIHSDHQTYFFNLRQIYSLQSKVADFIHSSESQNGTFGIYFSDTWNADDRPQAFKIKGECWALWKSQPGNWSFEPWNGILHRCRDRMWEQLYLWQFPLLQHLMNSQLYAGSLFQLGLHFMLEKTGASWWRGFLWISHTLN